MLDLIHDFGNTWGFKSNERGGFDGAERDPGKKSNPKSKTSRFTRCGLSITPKDAVLVAFLILS